jgi:transcriptional regulator with XRE-family HTH domain
MESSTNKTQSWRERIRKLRDGTGLTQEDFSKLFGAKGGSTVSGWEKGGFPDVGTLIKIANHFNLTVGQLLGEKEIPAHGAALESTIREIVKDELNSDVVEKAMEKAFDAIADRVEKRRREAQEQARRSGQQTLEAPLAKTAQDEPETGGGKQP